MRFKHLIRFLTVLVLLACETRLAFGQGLELPGMYNAPGYEPIRDYGDQFDTVDPYSGSLKIHHTDFVVPLNGSLDIVIQRTYEPTLSESDLATFGRYGGGKSFMGVGWDLHFGRIWIPGEYIAASNGANCLTGTITSPSGRPTLELPDGTTQILYSSLDSSSEFISTQRWIGRCLPTADDEGYGGLVIYSPEGTKYTFNKRGYVKYNAPQAYVPSEIEDRNGNTLTFSYIVDDDSSDFIDLMLLREVNSSQSPAVVFEYEDPTYGSSSSIGRNARLKRIKYASRTIEFGYSDISPLYPAVAGLTFFHLDHVELPDGEKWEYYYDSYTGNPNREKLHLNGLSTPLNADYTYHYGWVLNSALGHYIGVVEEREINNRADIYRWTYDYDFSSSVSGTDLTTVVTPVNCYKYTHKGYVPANDQWRIGTLLKRETRNRNGNSCGSTIVQDEVYVWESEKISNDIQYISRPETSSNNGTRLQRLKSLEVSRDSTKYRKTLSNYDSYGNPRTIITQQAGKPARTGNYTYDVKTSLWAIHLLDREHYGIGSNPNIDREYDSKGNLKSETVFGKATEYDYYGTGELRSVTDPDGIDIDYSDYFRGIPQTETQPDGITINRDISTYGNITAETYGALPGANRPSGRSDQSSTIEYSYDSVDRLKSITTPRTDDSNYSIAYTVDFSGLERNITRGTLNISEEYDNLGQLVKVTKEGISYEFHYDAIGRKIREYYPSSGTGYKSFTYDEIDRLERQDDNTDASSIEYQYLSNNRIRITDEDDLVTTYTFRSFDDPDQKELLQIDAPEGQTTVIDRDILGAIDSIRQGGVSIGYVYDSKRRLIQESRPETGTIEYRRDNRGNMTQRRVVSSPEGSTPWTFYEYDGHSRLTKIDYPAGTADVSFWYTKRGSIWEIDRGNSAWSYKYDNNENIEEEELTISGAIGKTYTLIRDYDSLDFEDSITYPSGEVLNRTRDDLSRITSIVQAGGLGSLVSSVQYHDSGNIRQYTYGNAKVISISENSRRRPEQYTVIGGGVADFKYMYSKAGDVKTIVDYEEPGKTKSFVYDGLHRLTEVTGNSGAWGTARFTYSSTGDLKSRRIGNDTFNLFYDSNKRVVSVSGAGSWNYDYDAYGNVVAKGAQTFVYDDASNLIRDSTSAIPNYAYDGHNLRYWQKTEDGQDIYSMYSLRGNLVFRENVQAATTSDYVYLDSLMVARIDYCETSTDSDNDGIPNCTETKFGTNPEVDDSTQDYDDDGLSNLDEYLLNTGLNNPDTDGDQIPDGYEVDAGLDPLDPSDADDDTDNDGLDNATEYQIGTLIDNEDTDSDGMSDGFEFQYGLNPTDDGDVDDDLDSDTLTNLEEYQAGTDPGVDDSAQDYDGDGLSNLSEYLMNTDLNNPDTDGDQIPDGYEVNIGLDPLDPSDASDDADNDGLNNAEEYQIGTLIDSEDTDSDGMPDGFEVLYGTNPLIDDGDDDVDNDSLTNLEEYQYGTNPLVDDSAQDYDGDGLSNLDEYLSNTGLNTPDTDGDQIPDGYEVDTGLDPLDPSDADDDTDNDGLDNATEYQIGTLIDNEDTDSDGMSDGFEAQYGLNPVDDEDAGLDPDGDTLTNIQEYNATTDPRNADTDGDGVNDGLDSRPTFNTAILIPIWELLLN